MSQGRDKIISAVRQVGRDIHSHVDQGRELQTILQQTLTGTPPEALFLFDETRRDLLDVIASHKDKESFLSGTKASDRITVDSHFLNRQRYATHVLKQRHAQLGNDASESSLKAGVGQVGQALEVVRSNRNLLAKRLAVLESSRTNVIRDFHELLRHIRNSSALGLSGDAANNLKAVARFILAEERLVGGRETKEDRVIRQQAVELLRGKNIILNVQMLTKVYLRELAANSPSVVEAGKRQVLKQAACRRARELDQQCRGMKRDRLPSVCRAIAALHFAYACEQHLDLGRMDSELRRSYDNLACGASQTSLEQAICHILKYEILAEKDFALLRYHKTIHQAFLQLKT